VKFLIDECLSPELAKRARSVGYGKSSHVVWLSLAGWKDWELMPVILDNDWTFVTRNSDDFRGPVSRPGSKGQYSGVALHAGLICLNGRSGLTIDLQIELFDHALGTLEIDPDLINRVIEVTLDEDDQILVQRYSLPP
jgi:Domain of unknown function (DUF5615)